MANEYVVFVILYFLGLGIRALYEQLKKKGRIDPKNKLTFIAVFFAMCLLWASWFSMCPLDPLQIAITGAVKWIGFSIFLIGMGFAIGALIQLRGVENIKHLETKGLFSKIRHPMYFGFILWIFGWAVYHGAIASLLAGLVAVINIFYWKRSEEKELESLHGEIYADYKNRTWF